MRARLTELGLPVPEWASVLECRRTRRLPRRPRRRRSREDPARRLRRQGRAARAHARATSPTGSRAGGRRCSRRSSSSSAASSPSSSRAARAATSSPGRVVETVQRDGVCVEVIAPGTRLRRSPRPTSRGEIAATIAESSTSPACSPSSCSRPPTSRILVNELAMRPHNSGHWTHRGLDHEPVRAAPARRARPAARRDRPAAALRRDGQRARRPASRRRDRYAAALADQPDVKLHFYGKAAAARSQGRARHRGRRRPRRRRVPGARRSGVLRGLSHTLGRVPEPLVAVVMGSDSDWSVMSEAAAALTEFGIEHEVSVVSAHRTPRADDRVRQGCGGPRHPGHHRRRRRCGAPARHARLGHDPAGDRRARAAEDPRRPRLAAVDRADARRHPRRDRLDRRRAQRRHPRRAHPRLGGRRDDRAPRGVRPGPSGPRGREERGAASGRCEQRRSPVRYPDPERTRAHDQARLVARGAQPAHPRHARSCSPAAAGSGGSGVASTFVLWALAVVAVLLYLCPARRCSRSRPRRSALWAVHARARVLRGALGRADPRHPPAGAARAHGAPGARLRSPGSPIVALVVTRRRGGVRRVRRRRRPAASSPTSSSPAPPEPPIDGRYNILLLGGDAGPDRDGLRPDSISVVSIDAETGAATIIGHAAEPRVRARSPTDSPLAALYPNGYGCGRLRGRRLPTSTPSTPRSSSTSPELYPNAAAEGSAPGIEAMRDAVEGVTGLTIQYYVLIDMQGFAAAHRRARRRRRSTSPSALPDRRTDETVTDESTAGSSRACSTWTAYTALWYARSRHGTSDYDRMARQRQVQEAILAAVRPGERAHQVPGGRGGRRAGRAHRHPAGHARVTSSISRRKTRELPIAALELVPPRHRPRGSRTTTTSTSSSQEALVLSTPAPTRSRRSRGRRAAARPSRRSPAS